MSFFWQGRVSSAAQLFAGVVVAAVTSVLLAVGASAQSRGDDCAKMLEESYGAVSVGGVSDRNQGGRKSVYADARLSNGQSVRVRCKFREGSISGIQVYVPEPLGSPNPGSSWIAADGLKTGPGKPAKSDGSSTEAKAPAEPEAAPPPEPEYGVRKRVPQS